MFQLKNWELYLKRSVVEQVGRGSGSGSGIPKILLI